DGEPRVFQSIDIGADEVTPHIDIVQSPHDTGLNKTLVPPLFVVVRDPYDNAFVPFNGPVSVAISTGPAGATLQGTTTANAVAGVIIFTDLSLDRLGTYVLSASTPSVGTAL